MLVELEQESVTNGSGGHSWDSYKFNSQIQTYSLGIIHYLYKGTIKDKINKEEIKKKKGEERKNQMDPATSWGRGVFSVAIQLAGSPHLSRKENAISNDVILPKLLHLVDFKLTSRMKANYQC